MPTTSEIANLITAARSGTANIKPLALKMRGQGQVFVAEALERLQDCVLSLSRALTATNELIYPPETAIATTDDAVTIDGVTVVY
jgi:hypothetical protein